MCTFCRDFQLGLLVPALPIINVIGQLQLNNSSAAYVSLSTMFSQSIRHSPFEKNTEESGREYKYISWCIVRIERSITKVTDWHQETCRVMPNSDPSDVFFYLHHTPMIDTFSCIPFDLPHLIFKVELAVK